MHSLACALVVLLFTPQAIGEVETHFDKTASFSAFRTYAWSKGHEAFDPAAHKMITEAIEAEMTGLGFTKADAGKADVLLTYHSVRSSEVDLKALDKLGPGQDAASATKILGRLAVVLSNPTSRATLWSAGTRRRLSDDPGKWKDEVLRAVQGLFDTYPGRKKGGK